MPITAKPLKTTAPAPAMTAAGAPMPVLPAVTAVTALATAARVASIAPPSSRTAATPCNAARRRPHGSVSAGSFTSNPPKSSPSDFTLRSSFLRGSGSSVGTVGGGGGGGGGGGCGGGGCGPSGGTGWVGGAGRGPAPNIPPAFVLSRRETGVSIQGLATRRAAHYHRHLFRRFPRPVDICQRVTESIAVAVPSLRVD
jgi:hypothetical protein